MDYYIENIKHHDPTPSESVWIRKPWKYSNKSGPHMGWGLILGPKSKQGGDEQKTGLLWEVYFHGEILHVSRDDIQRFMWWNRHLIHSDGSPRITKETV